VYELLAIGAGVVVGVAAQNLATIQLKVATLVLGSLVVGAIVAFISGELFESWAYLAFDFAQALLAAGVTVIVFTWWKQRASRQTRS
jgi:hypothetical protein